jgi:diamine N-acetyltransferase
VARWDCGAKLGRSPSAAGPVCRAVGAQLERGVRRHCASRPIVSLFDYARLWQHEEMQTSPLFLRQASLADALVIGVLGTQVSLDTYATQGIRPLLAREVLAHFSTDAIASLLVQPQTRFVLAEREDHLIGFVQLDFAERHELVSASPAVEVVRLFVQARFKGQGVGKALIAAACEQARGSGALSLWLTAWVGNTDALAWYRGQGWLERGPTDYVFEDEKFENRLFELPLGAR